jgi:hypothetical protein
MPDLSFLVESSEVVPFAAVPMLALKLQITNAIPDEAIHTVALRCQIEIEVARRRYTPEAQARMRDLFGDPERWSQTLRSMLWTHANLVVSGFAGQVTVVDLQIPCTFDFNIAATKYFEGLSDGDIPLHLMFSGTVFYADPNGQLQAAPISWEQETRYKLPVNTWREMMDTYYPNNAWLSLRRDVFDRLYLYKVQHGIPTWEQVLERMLPVEELVKS